MATRGFESTAKKTRSFKKRISDSIFFTKITTQEKPKVLDKLSNSKTFFIFYIFYCSRQPWWLKILQGGLFFEPVGGPQQDLAAIHCKTVPQSHSSPTSTIPSPQNVESTFFKQPTRWGASKLEVTKRLVHGDNIWWLSLWPSLENLDIKNRPLIHWKSEVNK